MKITDLMTKAPAIVSSETRLLQAAELMISEGVSALPVVSGDVLIGIVTEGDLLRRWESGTERKYQGFAVVKAGIDQIARDFIRSHGGYVRNLMTKKVVTIDEETPVEDAIRLIERHGFKQLPVIKDGKLTGILTRRNILEAFVASAERMSKEERSDEEIRRALLALYTREPWAPLDRMDLRVKDGVVEVLGQVESEGQRQAVIAAAEGTPGVKRVVDMMTDPTKADPTKAETASASIRSFVDGQSDDIEDQKQKT